MRVFGNESLEIAHQLLNSVLHVAMTILHPYLVFFADFHVLLFGSWFALVHYSPICYFVAIPNVQQVVRHSLISEFMEEGSEQIHRAISNV